MNEVISVQVDYTVIISLLIFSAMISTVLFIYIISRVKGGKIIGFFITGQILSMVWTVFNIFELLAPNVQIRWVIVVIEYIPLCFMGLFFFHFSYSYNYQKIMARVPFLISLIFPIVSYIAVITNPLHHMFYSSFDLKNETYEFFCWFIIVMTLLYLSLGALIFLIKGKFANPTRNRQSIYFVVAIMIPSIVHALLITGFLDFGFNITLIFIPFSVLLFTASVLKYQFLDVLPIAVKGAIDSMVDGILVISTKGVVIDANRLFFKKHFGMIGIHHLKNIANFYQLISPLVIDQRELTNLIEAILSKENQVFKGTFEVKREDGDSSRIHYTVSPLNDARYHKNASLITFFDITQTHALYTQLEQKNQAFLEANKDLEEHMKNTQQLAMTSERNKLMTEIHDTLGHSLVELLALIEYSNMVTDDTSIQEAIDKGRKSLQEVREAVSNYKKMGGLT